MRSSASFRQNKFARREALELVRAYYKIRNPAVRKRIFELTKAVASISPGIGETLEET